MKKIVLVFVEQIIVQQPLNHSDEHLHFVIAQWTVWGRTLRSIVEFCRHLHRLPLIPSADSYIFIRKPDIRFILEHLPE